MIPILNGENIKIHTDLFPANDYNLGDISHNEESGFNNMLKSMLDSQENKDHETKSDVDREMKSELVSVPQNETPDKDYNEKPCDDDFDQKEENTLQTKKNNQKAGPNRDYSLKNQKNLDKTSLKTDNKKEKSNIYSDNNNVEQIEAKMIEHSPIHDKLQAMLNQLLASNRLNPDTKKQLKESMQDLNAGLKTGSDNSKNIQILAFKIKKLAAKFESKIETSNSQTALPLELVKKIDTLLERMKNAKTKIQGEEKAKTTLFTAEKVELKEKQESALNKIFTNDPAAGPRGEQMPDAKSGLSFQFSGNSGENYAKATARTGNPAPAPQAPAFQEQLQSLLDKARINIKDSQNGNVSINLYPKQLGSISVNLGLEQGVINGKFLVENNEVKELLINNFDNIKQQLEDSGLNIGSFQVNVRNQNADHETKEILNYKEYISENKDIAAVYESNLQSFHNGSINITA